MQHGRGLPAILCLMAIFALAAGGCALATASDVYCPDSRNSHQHLWGDWTTIEPASCLQEGSRMRSCTLCGYEEIGVITMFPHTFTR